MRTTLFPGCPTSQDLLDWQAIIGVKPDGTFGPETERATKVLQTELALTPDGRVGPLTWAAVMEHGLWVSPPTPIHVYPYIQAKHYSPTRHGTPITVIVQHAMQSPEKPGTARGVATWFERGVIEGDPTSMRYPASAHFCIDPIQTIQCVRLEHQAFGAGGANRNGIHIELAGRSEQTDEQWTDEASEAILSRSAALTAELCRRYGIPVKRIGPDELVAGARGICGHVDVTRAFHKGDHTDPGAHFPWAHFIDLVIQASDPNA